MAAIAKTAAIKTKPCGCFLEVAAINGGTKDNIFFILMNIPGLFGMNDISDGYAFTAQKVSVYTSPMIPQWMLLISLFGAMLWLITIQIGLYHNLKSMDINKLSKIKEHVLILLISPIATVIDTGVAFFTLITWSLGYKKAVWDVTPKLLEVY